MITAQRLLIGFGAAMLGTAAGAAEKMTINPRGFPYPDRFDSVRAAPGQHHLLYEDENVRLLEVTYLPNQKGDAFHGHPYPSVFAFPSGLPHATDHPMDPKSFTAHGTVGGPPAGLDGPQCLALGAQAPHQPDNTTDIPDHFYRIEFKHLEGESFKTDWQKLYPYMSHRRTLAEWLKESGKKPFGQATLKAPDPDAANKMTINPKEFPYPDSFDSVAAAPGQHWLRFENASIRFIEVIYVANIKGDAMHGHPYPSVFAIPGVRPKVTSTLLVPDKRPAQAAGGPPEGMTHPTCNTMGVQLPHQPEVHDDFPDHFYRIEFKRLDGKEFDTHWREWYPAMAKAADAAAAKRKPKAK